MLASSSLAFPQSPCHSPAVTGGLKDDRRIVLFHPSVPGRAIDAVQDVLRGRWIGQGPRVDAFESAFRSYLGSSCAAVAVGAGTDALHLAYILAGVGPEAEVVAPVFTCSATNIPLLYQGARIRFADIQPHSMNIDPNHVRDLVNERTRAIVCVHYGGLPCDMTELQRIASELGIPIIEDAAQALGASYHGVAVGDISDFTAFSFQALKHVTTGDGGMLMIRSPLFEAPARRMRWFGIDRAEKLEDRWRGDITEVGYKYQMNDIAAAMGLAGLEALDAALAHRRRLLQEYSRQLDRVADIEVIGGGDLPDREHAAWLCTVRVPDAQDLRRKLEEHGIESAPVHYRNDGYSIFAKSRGSFPAMDALDGKYLVLPVHARVSLADVERICAVIRS